MIKEKLIEKFGGDVNHMSCVYLREGETRLRSFLEGKKFDTIIEIGTYRGVAACVLSEYAKKVYTFDIVDKPLRDTFINYLGIKNIKFNLVKDRKDEIKKVSEVFKKEKVDLCFIDGEHFNGELEKDYDMCKECNNIIIHDYTSQFPEIYNFVNGLKGYEKKVNDTFVLLTKKDNKKLIKESFKRTLGRTPKSKTTGKNKSKTKA